MNYRKDKKKRIIAGAIAILIIVAMLFSLVVSAFAEEQAPAVTAKAYDLELNTSTQAVFPRGVSFEGISLEGKTRAEADQLITNYVNERINRPITWDILGYQYEYSAGSFATVWSNPDAVSALDDKEMSGNLVEQYKKQKDVDMNPVNVDLQFTYDESLIRGQVEAYVQQYTVTPTNATVTRGANGFVVTEGVNGVSFDTEAIITAICAKVGDFSTADAISYSFPFHDEPATYNSASFNFSPNPIGSYTTSRLGTGGRKNNIALSAYYMNGHVFYPGETISTLAMYGPVTAEAGYQLAPGYNQGKVEDTIGGGICQTTTTLYNAVLRAELTVPSGSRRNHSMMVSYVPPAMDATVAPPYSDFQFVNTSNYPIYIESYVYGDSVTVNIWGVEERPANRTIAFYQEIHEVTWPVPLYNTVVNDTACRVGEYQPQYKIKSELDPHPKVKATAYKIVYVDGVEVERIALNTDVYKPLPGVIHHASDCTVKTTLHTNCGTGSIFPYLLGGTHVTVDVLTTDGEMWPAYPN